ncbi:Uncharacterised protein [Yokenella regensburgei]|nr:Uncharacterised protein [Yokenella regensburgei]
MVFTPPNSNLLFAVPAAVPLLRRALPVGEHLLISAVWAGDTVSFDASTLPQVSRDETQIRIVTAHHDACIQLAPLPR